MDTDMDHCHSPHSSRSANNTTGLAEATCNTEVFTGEISRILTNPDTSQIHMHTLLKGWERSKSRKAWMNSSTVLKQ